MLKLATCFTMLLVVFLPIGDSTDTKIKEPPSYEAKIVPENFKDARLALGYDNFQRLPTSGGLNQPKKYAWDNNGPQVKLNFRF